ncbi:MAG TPA: hypothetical protein PKY59_16780, partial [Pyrinomonadaceae bacterium]|nr:hypothetical protein [Pyrinomonadaceae bacterium]
MGKINQAFKIKRDYDDAKKAAVEHVVNNIESRTSKVLVTLLFIFIVFQWIYAIFSSSGLEKISEKFGNAPFILPLLASYFFFFIGSKLIFKPTEEELSDDTSMFAIFSACERRERRSFYS